MNIKQIFLSILLIVWMIIIFLFSNQTASKSQSVSDGFTLKLVDCFSTILNKNLDASDKAKIVKKLIFFIRKCAHFTEYFILGLLVFLNLDAYHCNRKLLFSILFCFLYACTDEFHQIFLDGRTANFLDVLIDTFGGFVGSCLVLFIKK